MKIKTNQVDLIRPTIDAAQRYLIEQMERSNTLTPEHRAGHDRELVEFYRQQLQANGAGAPSLDELWQQYQWHAAYVWVGAVVTLAMGEEWQPVNYILSSLERLHPALETLGSVEAIRSAL